MQVRGQLRCPAALPSGGKPPNPINKRLDGPQIRSGRFGEQKKKSLAPDRRTLLAILDSNTNNINSNAKKELLWLAVLGVMKIIFHTINLKTACFNTEQYQINLPATPPPKKNGIKEVHFICTVSPHRPVEM